MSSSFSLDNYEEFMHKLASLGADLDQSAQRVLDKAVNEARRVAVQNTPVGDYSKDVSFTTKSGQSVNFRVAGRVGGTLKRSWAVKRAEKQGKDHVAELYNTADYALYVNNGHRVVNHDHVTAGYVKGQFMLEKGLDAARRNMQGYFNEEIRRVKEKNGF